LFINVSEAFINSLSPKIISCNVDKKKRIIRFKGMSTAALERHLEESKGKKLPARARKRRK